MKRRIIKTGAAAREKMAEGAEMLAEAIGSTIGPFGQNFYLDKKDTITNDGVTIAREFQLMDEVKNRGVKAIREAANKTVDQAGDGTSTSIVLAYQIYKAASRFLDSEHRTGKKSGTEIKKQIDTECTEVIQKLETAATKVDTKEELVKSAIVSTEDEQLGRLIAEAQWELGSEGVLLAEDSNDKTCSVERVRGIRLDNGFGSSGVVNNPEKWQMEVDECHILLTSHTIKDAGHWNELLKLFQSAQKSGITHLVVVARAWTDETISFCLQQLNRSAFKVYPLNAPYIDQPEVMKDLAAITGAHFYDSESSELSDIMTSGLGRAKRVIGRRMESIIEGYDEAQYAVEIAKRLEDIKKQREGSESEFEKKALSTRIAQLENGFAIVKIGAHSDMEKRRLLDKADDAINAVKCVMQEGTIRGAGIEAMEIAKNLPDDSLLKRPLMSINELIMSSAPEGFVVEEWVRDPLKVWRCALQNACAAAGAFATASGVITEEFPKRLDSMFGKQLQQAETEVDNSA